MTTACGCAPGGRRLGKTRSDQTTRFHLRRGCVSDGRPLTAHDVASSLTAARGKDWVTRHGLQSIRQVRALDARRVSVETSYPYLVLPRYSRGSVLPTETLERVPVPAVGSGPDRLESWQPGREFVLVRNRYFRGPAPHFERRVFRMVPDAGERIETGSGEARSTRRSLPVERLGEVETEGRLRVHAELGTGSSTRAEVLDSPFGDPRVRGSWT